MPASEVFHKFKHGKLHSGSKKGPVVTNPEQMKAIYMSEKRNESAHSGHYTHSERKNPLRGTRRKR